MSKNLRRLEALERGTQTERLQVIEVFDHQTQEDALAAYENDNGPVGPDNGSLLLVFIRKPVAAA
jgi:hypothetical protein